MRNDIPGGSGRGTGEPPREISIGFMWLWACKCKASSDDKFNLCVFKIVDFVTGRFAYQFVS